MKKYIFVMLTIGIIISSVLIINGMEVGKKSVETFKAEGYILNSKQENNTQKVEKYYFDSDSTYKKQYNSTISFKDTNGEKVVVDDSNFLHYTNGSISSLTKGVIMDLSGIDDDPIIYYTISANNELQKVNENYLIKRLNQNLSFRNYIWKISDNKYLICGAPLVINFETGETKEVNGYIELEYIDNEVVKIYNQDINYQTVSADFYITALDNIKINLSNKLVSKDGEIRMSLNNMVINSDDNVEIIDIYDELYKEELEKLEETEGTEENKETENENENNNNNGANNNEGSNGRQITEEQYEKLEELLQKQEEMQAQEESIAQQTQTQQTTQQQQTTTPSQTEVIIDETVEFTAPTFVVEKLEADSVSMTSVITVNDEKESLVGNSLIKVIRNDTGKVVYETEESTEKLSLDVAVSTLRPNTEYVLTLQASFQLDEALYTRNFIYKMFRTEPAGIEVEKNYFTNNVLSFRCNVKENSKINNADVVLMNEEGETLETRTVYSASEIVDFEGLTPNTKYYVQIKNVRYDNQIISDGFEASTEYMTLKDKPEIGETKFEIDKKNNRFIIASEKVEDPDGGILSCRYEIYDTRTQGEEDDPVLTINTSKNEQAIIPVDGVVIQRGVPYTFKLIVEFYDNEKVIEFESEYSDIMMMDGVEFPSVRFEPELVTFERIEGLLIIQDDSNTIDVNNCTFTVVYTDSVGTNKQFTSQGSLMIPVSVNGLRANETYKFAVYTTVDLQDDNPPVENCHIGGAVVKTEMPQDLVATFSRDTSNYKDVFSIDFRLINGPDTVGDLEARVLTGLTFTIYAGQTTDGSPARTPLRIVDTNIEPYESVIKENFYDKSIKITPEFFGYNNKDFRDKYYTITVTNAYDYTEYKNIIPILQNTFVIETNGSSPDLPPDVNDALTVQEIKNRTVQLRDDLEPGTTVGYKVKAKFTNTDLVSKIVRYCAYDATTNKLVAMQDFVVGSDGVVPTATFDVEDGTPQDVDDSENGLFIDDSNKAETIENHEFTFENQPLRRGNDYYFAYFMWFDLDNNGELETLYPYIEENVILRSPEYFPAKQEPNIHMYPSKSTSNSITYKYTILDVDKSLQSNQMVASIENAIKDTEEFIVSTADNVQTSEVTFYNLTAGNFSVTISSSISKNEFATARKICNFYFESRVNINQIEYTVKVESNKVMVTLLNVGNNLNRIAAVDLQFVGNSNRVVNKQFISPTSETISVDLSDLEILKKENITISVFAYYDTGLIGFDMESNYKLFEKNYLNGNTRYYYNLNSENVLVPVPSASGKMYIATLEAENKKLKLSPPTNPSKVVPINLMVLEAGYAYEYELFNQKQIERKEIACEDTNVISFDDIIPSITKKNIISELAVIRFKADVLVQGSTRIADNLFYIDIYKTDANGSDEQFYKTINVTLEQFNDYVLLSELEPKNYYAFRVRTKMVGDGGVLKEVYLYDTEQQIVGRTYYASTLADVGINGISVKYNPVSYEEKTLDIEYNLEEIFGYQKIVYTLQRLNPETNNFETIIDNIEDTLFKSRMIKKIECPPGSNITFDDRYNIIIKPLAIFDDKELEVGTESYEFKLAALTNPFVGIKGIRESNHVVSFKITVYDDSKIVVGNEYTIKVFNSNNEDITPAQYADQKYSTSLLNNKIELQNTEYTEGYTLKVYLQVDRENSGTDFVNLERQYKLLPVNENGISVGNITATNNAFDRSKVDLVFYESSKITEITNIKYSIYNINGYSTNGSDEFVPTRIGSDEESIYKYTINKSLEDVGRYYIELQFLKEDFVMETYSLEYTYLGD